MNISFINDSVNLMSQTKYIPVSECQSAFSVLNVNYFFILLAFIILAFIFSTKLKDSLRNRYVTLFLLGAMFLLGVMTEQLYKFSILNKFEINFYKILFYIIFILFIGFLGWKLDQYLKKKKESLQKNI